MRTNLKIFLVTILFPSMFLLNGCILDSLKTITQNAPMSQEFKVNSSQTSYSATETIDLSNSSTYQSYQDKIQQIKFIQAEFRTKSVTPTDLSGNVTLILKDNSGNTLVNYSLGQINPSDYITNPFQLQLNDTQIAAINAYLSILSNKKLKATLQIDNISSSVKPYSLDCVLDIVFELKAKT